MDFFCSNGASLSPGINAASPGLKARVREDWNTILIRFIFINYINFIRANNYPNPFNPSTTITFELAQHAQVEIKVFDILGREVTTLLNDHIAAGRYELIWDGKNRYGISVGSGVFIYEIQAKAAGQMLFNQSRKMVLLR